jgi:hypothetical protein
LLGSVRRRRNRDATAATCELCFGYGRTCSLRLRFDAEIKKKLAIETLRPAVPDERQPDCFGLEEERGGNWKGSNAPVIKEARPSL